MFKANRGVKVAGTYHFDADGVIYAKSVNQIVNVVAFGAKGDGVTDDSNAFAKAVQFCLDYGGILFLPKGKYYTPTYQVPDTVTQLHESGILIQSDKAYVQLGKKKPDTPGEGSMYFDSNTSRIMFYSNGEWDSLLTSRKFDIPNRAIDPQAGIHQVGGGFKLQKMKDPDTPTVRVIGTAGNSVLTYLIVAQDKFGNYTEYSLPRTINNSNSSLTSTNYNIIEWLPVEGAEKYYVFKGSKTALLGSTTSTTFEDKGQPTTTTPAIERNSTADMSIEGDLVLEGNLTVRGESTIVNSKVVEVDDNIITLNKNIKTGTPPEIKSGLEVRRGSLKPAQIVFDEIDDKWKVDNGDGVLRELYTQNSAYAFGMVDVRELGAKGDGTTDNTEAFRKAESSSSMILIPPGTYIVNLPSIDASKYFGIGKVVNKGAEVVIATPARLVKLIQDFEVVKSSTTANSKELNDARTNVEGTVLPTLKDHLNWITRNAQVRFEKYDKRYVISSPTNQVLIDLVGFNQSKDIITVYQNSTYLKKDSDYKISSDNKYIVKTEGSWAQDTTIDYSVMVTKQAQGEEVALIRLEGVVEITQDNTTEVRIPMDQFNSTTDLLTVLHDNLQLYQGEQYSIAPSGDKILLTYPTTIGDRIYFIALKKIREDLTPGADGSTILDNSIGNAKLHPDIKIGSLTQLVTNDKSSLVKAINEVYLSKSSSTVIVTNFGTKGDGVIDDTQAFQSAIDYCSANKVATLVVPPGTYAVRKLIIKSNVNIVGTGSSSVIKGYWAANYADYGIVYFDKSCSNSSISNIKIDANGAERVAFPNGTVVDNAIRLEGCSNIKIDSVIIVNASKGYSISCLHFFGAGTSPDQMVRNIVITNSEITVPAGGVHGINVVSGSNITIHNNIINNTLSNGYCIDLESATPDLAKSQYYDQDYSSLSNIKVSNNTCYGSGVAYYGQGLSKNKGIVITNNYIEITKDIHAFHTFKAQNCIYSENYILYKNPSASRQAFYINGRDILVKDNTVELHNNCSDLFVSYGTQTIASDSRATSWKSSDNNRFIGNRVISKGGVPVTTFKISDSGYHTVTLNKIEPIASSQVVQCTSEGIDFINNSANSLLWGFVAESSTTVSARFIRNTIQCGKCNLSGIDRLFISENEMYGNNASYAMWNDLRGANNKLIYSDNIIIGLAKPSDYILGPVVSYSNSEPTSGSWKVSDRVENTVPIPGSFVGWICTTTGTATNVSWSPSKAYKLNDIVNSNGAVYKCIQAGTSGTTPLPSTAGSDVNDGSCKWTYVSKLAIFKPFGPIGL
ncbi:hypothetical protein HSE3_gp094 [Bacillus phage vB_BceM-HSE3]|nr:hypothetical protein HSE3_gp094 [Bacillus phage vB_BceM-HSE3]